MLVRRYWLLVLAVLLCGCTGPGGLGGTNPSSQTMIIVPFIEDVQYPMTVVQGEIVTITVRYSAGLMPGVMDNPSYRWNSGGGGPYDHNAFLQLTATSAVSGPGDEVSFNLVAEELGTILLKLGTTETRATGGTRLMAQDTPSFVFPAGAYPVTQRVFAITVLPSS